MVGQSYHLFVSQMSVYQRKIFSSYSALAFNMKLILNLILLGCYIAFYDSVCLYFAYASENYIVNS